MLEVDAAVATGRASGTIPERVLLLPAGRASPAVAAGVFVVVVAAAVDDDDDDDAAAVVVRLGWRLLLLLLEAGATACGILERERVGILVTAISLFQNNEKKMSQKEEKENWN